MTCDVGNVTGTLSKGWEIASLRGTCYRVRSRQYKGVAKTRNVEAEAEGEGEGEGGEHFQR